MIIRSTSPEVLSCNSNRNIVALLQNHHIVKMIPLRKKIELIGKSISIPRFSKKHIKINSPLQLNPSLKSIKNSEKRLNPITILPKKIKCLTISKSD